MHRLGQQPMYRATDVGKKEVPFGSAAMASQLTQSGTCQPGPISSMPPMDKGTRANRPRPSIIDTDAGLLVLGLTHYLDSLNLGESPFNLGMYSRNLASPSGVGLVQNYKLLSVLLPHFDHGLVRCGPLTNPHFSCLSFLTRSSPCLCDVVVTEAQDTPPGPEASGEGDCAHSQHHQV